MSKKSPNPVDRHVGSRVRMRRMLIGMSQDKLGQTLGLTFQQVQKYEKGTNRIGASRLQQIAGILGVTVDYLFEGAPALEGVAGEVQAGFAEPPASEYVADFMSTSDGLQLMKHFMAIKSPRVRRRLVDLAAALAGEDAE